MKSPYNSQKFMGYTERGASVIPSRIYCKSIPPPHMFLWYRFTLSAFRLAAIIAAPSWDLDRPTHRSVIIRHSTDPSYLYCKATAHSILPLLFFWYEQVEQAEKMARNTAHLLHPTCSAPIPKHHFSFPARNNRRIQTIPGKRE